MQFFFTGLFTYRNIRKNIVVSRMTGVYRFRRVRWSWGGGAVPGMGGVSPGGSRPKTMKEFEEELMDLRRDNFDLRMRIYLLEEQEDTANITSLDHQSITSRLPPSFAQLKELYFSNTQLKEEIATLQKQLSEKEELVLQAATAVETLEKNHIEKLNQIKSDADKECHKLQETIAQLTQEVIEIKMPNLRSVEKSAIFDDSNAMYAMAFGLPVPNKSLDPEKVEAKEIISSLELKLIKIEKDFIEESSRRVSCDDKLDKLRIELKKSEDSRRHLSDELKHRESELAKAHRLIEEKCQSLTELQEKLQTKFSKPALDSLQNEKRPVADGDAGKLSGSSLGDFQDQLTQLREQIKSQKLENIRLQEENMKAMRTIQGLVKHNKALTRDLEHYKSDQQNTSKSETLGGPSSLNKDNRITELEAEVTVLKEKLSTVSFGAAQEGALLTDLSLLRLELEAKNSEIESLNEELKKRTFNLQELVNKELWDKNREIEKLNQTCDRKQGEFNSLKQELNMKNQELIKLRKDFEQLPQKELIVHSEGKENKNPNSPLTVVVDEKLKEDLKLYLEDNNNLKLEVEKLNKRLSEQSASYHSLKEDCKKWQMTAEESEKSRKELVNACTLLTTRLEELSTFLESLLPSLGSKKRRMLQQAIDQSREMSRSFAFMDQSHLSISIPLLPDVSQVDFCSGDETLTKLEEKVDSSENDEVAKLRNQVESLVERLHKKETTPEKSRTKIAGIWPIDSQEKLEDITEGSLMDSLSEVSDVNLTTPGHQRASLAIIARPAADKPAVPAQFCLSESDGGWSEPDRNVSKERIGIKEVPPQKLPNSSEDSVKSNRKSPSGKKSRNEGLVELKRLSAKLDSLEQMSEALHAEIQVLHRANVVKLDDKMIINKPNSPKSLRDIFSIRRRRSVDKSLANDNQFNCESKNPDINELSERIKEISVQLESSCRSCLELEEKCLILENERKVVEFKLNENTERLKTVEADLEQALATIKEKDNQVLEKQCALLEANNNNILLSAKLEAITENLNVKQDHLEKFERELSEKEEKTKEIYKEMEEFKKKSEEFESQLKSKLESCQREVEEAVSRRLETERRLIVSYEHQTEIRTRLDQEIIRSKDFENQFKHEERSWRRRLSENEVLRAEREAELRKKLDAAVLTTSEAVLERTRLANDKLKLQQDLRAKETTHFSVMKELETRIAELESVNSELEAAARCRWEVRQEPLGARSPTVPHSPGGIMRSPTLPCSPSGIRSPISLARSPTSTTLSPPLSPCSPRSPRPPRRLLSNPSSDYVSDQDNPPYQLNANFWMPASGRSNNNCSPDLGIESDHHSLAAGKMPSLELLPLPLPASNGDVTNLVAENEHLRTNLFKTRKALADAVSRLTSANQKKRQVERDICKQIHKNHSVLQKARVNFEQNENHPPVQ